MDDDARTRFGDFVASRTPALMRFAYLLCGDRHGAEDLLQSALAKTVARWATLRHEDPEGYVRTVMLREQVSWWRRLRRYRETPLTGRVEVVGADPSDQSDLRLAMRAALAQLPPAQRAVLVLRYYEDLNETQIRRRWPVRSGPCAAAPTALSAGSGSCCPRSSGQGRCGERPDRGSHPSCPDRSC